MCCSLYPVVQVRIISTTITRRFPDFPAFFLQDGPVPCFCFHGFTISDSSGNLRGHGSTRRLQLQPQRCIRCTFNAITYKHTNAHTQTHKHTNTHTFNSSTRHLPSQPPFPSPTGGALPQFDRRRRPNEHAKRARVPRSSRPLPCCFITKFQHHSNFQYRRYL